MVFIVGVILVLIAAAFYFKDVYPSRHGGGALSSQAVQDKISSYIQSNVPDAEILIKDLKEENGLYRMIISVSGQEYVSYATKDGKLLFPQAIDLDSEKLVENTDESGEEQPVQPGPVEVVKSDRPDVKLFVMSYCPYGLQAQKALLPAWELLKSRAEIGIYFVDYLMHGKEELDENLTQYCVEKEQSDKIISYLNCFTLEGDSETCLGRIGIDSAKLAACVVSTDQSFGLTAAFNNSADSYPGFDIHTALNQAYGVTGSPTLVINGQVVSPSDRSPEAFKQAICQAFETPPAECDQVLSTVIASPGIGGDAGNSSSGGCE